ncbi:hypothetical protein RP20_CCG019566 [Aedes albopictus]|nr:hypothetical protein RP20_CCG019566 [Aedes albopictus]
MYSFKRFFKRCYFRLRKKAGEYRNRGWGGEINPDLFNKQQELWDQVSRRSSLSALSLASSVRPITKEEKEKENNKKSSPTKPYAPGRGKIPGSARPVEIGKTLPDGLAFSRSRKDNIRHHLERTTGADVVEEGALLPSPTREKLMPAIPRSKGDSPQRGSPQKTGLSRHGSPQKGSPQKSSPKKMSSKGRSQSVGPAVATDNSVASVGGGSPKRQIRSGSTATASTAASAAKAHNKKTPTTATAPSSQPPERRPRPTTLSTTTTHSRSKSNTVPHSGHTRVHSAPPSRPPPVATNNNNNNNNNINSNIQNNNTTINNINNNNHLPTNQTHPLPAAPDRSNNNSIPNITSSTTTTTTTHPSRAKLTLGPKIGSQNRPRAASATSTTAASKTKQATKPATKGKIGELGPKSAGNEDDAEKDGGVSVSSASPLPAPEITEQIIKSPPEPTRVKSPEQIIMRSPDPVNWTVPLDTGKTFTVTQNVREGELYAVDHPPPAPQSAPPELSEQIKLPNTKLEPDSIKESEDEDEDMPKSRSSVASSVNQPISVAVPVETAAAPATTVPQPAVAAAPSAPAQTNPEPARFDKPVPGSTLRCLEDPDFESDINSPVGSRNVASEVLDKARDRFDRFWGNPDGAKPDES